MGATGTTIVVRLSAFLLFCIGIQVLWNGAAELLGHAAARHAPAQLIESTEFMKSMKTI